MLSKLSILRVLLGWTCLGGLVSSATAQTYLTTPNYANPSVMPSGNTNQNAFASTFSGNVFAPTNRPSEAGTKRYQIASWSAGANFTSGQPDFTFGDPINPPPMVDTTVAPTVLTANGAFYLPSTKQLIAAQGGAVRVAWPLITGGSNTVTYNIGSVPSKLASRLFWTDNYSTVNAVQTNPNKSPDNSDYAVSLKGVYGKIHYNITVPNFDSINSQDTPDGRSGRSVNAVTNMNLAATWIDDNDLLRSRNQTGYFIVEYFDTSSYSRSVAYEVVYVGGPVVYNSYVTLGSRLLPHEGASVANDSAISVSTAKASDYVTRWTAAGSDFYGQVFAVAVNTDSSHALGDTSKTQLLWQRTGTLGVIWPYELDWYGIDWPGDAQANLFVFDAGNLTNSPRAQIPGSYSASVVWEDSPGKVLGFSSQNSTLSPLGEGRALVQYQNATDVWMVPVRVVSSTNGAYVSAQQVYWPVGTPLQPFAAPAQLQFNGLDTQISLETELDPGLTVQMWVNPATLTNVQNLAAWLDYPQQAMVQACLYLSTNRLCLSVLTNGTTGSALLTSKDTLAPNVWSHVAFTKSSSGSLKLFLNGVLQATSTVTSFNGQAVGRVTYGQCVVGGRLGQSGAAAQSLAGYLGQFNAFQVWSTEIPAVTLAVNMSVPLTGTEGGLTHLLTSEGLQSRDPADPSGTSFSITDKATGSTVAGQGGLMTTGTMAYPMPNQIAFDGVANWLQFPLALSNGGVATIEFKITPAQVGNASLLALTAPGVTNLGVSIRAGSMALAIGANNVPLVASSILVNGTYSVALILTNNMATLYLGSQSLCTTTLPGAGTNTLSSLALLATGLSNGPYAGVISDLRIYSSARSKSQIADDILSPADLTDSSLQQLYTFDALSQKTLPGSTNSPVFTLADQARGWTATYYGSPALGAQLSFADMPEFTGGIVRSGTAYHAAVYQAEGRILPVNDLPTNRVLQVWWPSTYTAPYLDTPLQFPGQVNNYVLMDPLVAPTLVVAGQNTSRGYEIPSSWTSPVVYYGNDPTRTGFNPNEEHAMIIGSSVYALRWDLNGDNTSHNYVLLQYQDSDQGYQTFLQPIWVVPTNSQYPSFDSTLNVGQLLQAPMPLPDLPASTNSHVVSGTDPNHRLYQDRQFAFWAISAVTTGTNYDGANVAWWYPMQPSFYWPTTIAAGGSVPFGDSTSGKPIRYSTQWPTPTPVLALGQTLSDAVPSADGNGYLPAVAGQLSVDVLYDAAKLNNNRTTVVLEDPSTTSATSLSRLVGLPATEVNYGLTYFTTLPAHLRNRVYWDPVALKLNLTGKIVRPVTGFPYVEPAWLSPSDCQTLLGLSTDSQWQTAVGNLRRTANLVGSAETPFTELVLTPTSQTGGYVTLGVNTRTNLNLRGVPVAVYPMFVDTNRLYTGVINSIYSDNAFDQYMVMRHSGDFGGDPSQFTFDWRYTFPVDGRVPNSNPSSDDGWISHAPATAGLNNVVFGGPGLLTLQDLYFTVRWRSMAAGSPNTNWSSWTDPVLVQSWLTRAMNGINPYTQRVNNLAASQPDLSTSLLTGAGKRYVGDVPLNTENADQYGLIEIYETLLGQARNISIDAGYSDDNVNASLLESASKLNDLYNILGDEAFSDAQDPTVAWGNRDLNDILHGSRASSLFPFEGEVPNLNEETLALLRGRDNTSSTPVSTYPVYNRLYWNFTGGINTGEPAYAVNYGTPSVAGDPTGSITAADAAKLYPQGHGDAYGHYLTALSEYYRLLANTNFTWRPRTQVVPVEGVNVTFYYEDEKRMASTAAQLGRVALMVAHETFKKDFSFNPSSQVPLFQDSNTNRAWSASEWCNRSSQLSYINWAVLNSLLPAATDFDTAETISRATVPGLSQVADNVSALQDLADAIDRGDSPMQVSANVVPFDLDPALLDNGISHFEQIYGRAVSALSSAYNALQQSCQAALDLRRQNTSLESFRRQVIQRETELNNQLTDLYGTPYADDIGPTGAFITGYSGPDLYHYNYIDPGIFDPATAGAVTNLSVALQYSLTGDKQDILAAVGTKVTYSVNREGIPVIPSNWNGSRAIYGKIQDAVSAYIHAWTSLRAAVANQQNHGNELASQLQRLQDHSAYSDHYGAIGDSLGRAILTEQMIQNALDSTLKSLDIFEAEMKAAYAASKDPIPASFIVGLANGGDMSFPARIGMAVADLIGEETIGAAKNAASFGSFAASMAISQLTSLLDDNATALADAEYQSQVAMTSSILLSKVNADRDSVYAAAVDCRHAWQTYVSLIAKGNRLQSDLTTFRAENASRVQQARYGESIFRSFRNEALQNYGAAYDMAARYAMAAAKVYDFETGLLDPTVVTGRSGDFLGSIIRAEQIGDMVDGQPQLAPEGANTLANVLAQMRANWTTLKGRFSINNPTLESHALSLRWEAFRIGNAPGTAMQHDYDTTWQNKLYTCKVADIRQVAEFKNFCQTYSPMQTNEPAIVIRFSTEINQGKNLFGLPLSSGDTYYDPTHFTTKIRGSAISFFNYNGGTSNLLTTTPRAYLFPVGTDRQRTPMDGGATVRDWHVVDQVWPIPYPSAAGNVSLSLQDLGTDNVHLLRKFPEMLAYDSADLASRPAVSYDSRLVGRSLWNTSWCLIIPASSLSSSTSTSLDTFIQNVQDIKIHLQTYSYSGN